MAALLYFVGLLGPVALFPAYKGDINAKPFGTCGSPSQSVDPLIGSMPGGDGSATVYNEWLERFGSDELPLEPLFGYASAKLSFEPPKRWGLHPQVMEMLVLNGGITSCISMEVNSPCVSLSGETIFLALSPSNGYNLHLHIDEMSGKPGPRYLHTAVSFPDILRRPVVFYGGASQNKTALGEVWYLEQAAGGQGLTWREGPRGPLRYGHSAIKNGTRMVSFGGCNSSVCFNDMYSYDVVNEKWESVAATGQEPSPRGGHAASTVPGSTPRMLVHGGMSEFHSTSPYFYGDTYSFDMSTKLWTSLSVTPTGGNANIAHAASIFFEHHEGYGNWLLFGVTFSEQQSSDIASTLSLRVPSNSVPTQPWVVHDESNFIRYPERLWMASMVSFNTTTGRQIAYMIGGSGDVVVEHQEFFDPLSDFWSVTERGDTYEWVPVCPFIKGPEPRAGHTALQLQGPSIYIFGGVIEKPSSLIAFANTDVWRLAIEGQNQFQGGIWQKYTPTVTDVHGVVGHVSVGAKLLSSDNDTRQDGPDVILSFGGFLMSDSNQDGKPHLINSVAAIAPSLLVWAVLPKTGRQPLARAYHSGVVHNSTLYVYGGIGNVPLAPLGDTWSLNWSGSVEQLQNWTLISNSQSTTPVSPGPRFGHSAVVAYDPELQEDVMLVFGGTNSTVVFADLWKFVFSSLQWEMLPSLRSTCNSSDRGLFGHSTNMIGQKMVVYGGCRQVPEDSISDEKPIPKCPRTGVSSQIVYFDIVRQKWAEIQEDRNTVQRYLHTSIYTGGVLNVYGGFSDNFTIYSRHNILRPGCNDGYEGDFSNDSCYECPLGSYSSAGGPQCLFCRTDFTTTSTGSRSVEDCNKCNVPSCKGHCQVTQPNQMYACECNFFYKGVDCKTLNYTVSYPAIVCGVIVLAFIVILCVQFKLLSRLRKLFNSFFTAVYLLKNFKLASWSLKIEEFEIKSVLSKAGSYSTVYRATYLTPSNRIDVALKMGKCLTETKNRNDLEMFQEEVLTLKSVYHHNIVSCYGGGTEKTDKGLRHFIALELILPGDLSIVLHDCLYKQRVTLELPLQVKLALDAARGIAHMHKVAKRIHLDIKPGNLLLNWYGVVKLADFNTARLLQQDRERNRFVKKHGVNSMWKMICRCRDMDDSFNSPINDEFCETSPLSEHSQRSYEKESSSSVGTWGYMSPEAEGGTVGPSSDSYSFGVVLCEIVLRKRPGSTSADIKLLKQMLFKPRETTCLLPGTKDDEIGQPPIPEYTREATTLVEELIESCWSKNPSERPFFEDSERGILSALKKVSKILPSPNLKMLEKQLRDVENEQEEVPQA